MNLTYKSSPDEKRWAEEFLLGQITRDELVERLLDSRYGRLASDNTPFGSSRQK
jgi:hypothetical protein